VSASLPYVGRLAPSPTGLLHLGHARTFHTAWLRARQAGGLLRLRNDDLDAWRCQPGFVEAMLEDLTWIGLTWDGPMVCQTARRDRYLAALRRLREAGAIYACHCTRKDVAGAAGAPHEAPGGPAEGAEPVFPAVLRPPPQTVPPPIGEKVTCNWRFRVPDGEVMAFEDTRLGHQQAVAGVDFGDFLVWRKDDTPSYQLACAVDDAEMGITEVVRGADLVLSTFRQRLLFRALGHPSPAYHHCPLVLDDAGQRLAKRHDALALRTLRARGVRPETLFA
jgi:glutamyl/glutaminyl-tRNA synthetase